MDLDRFFQVKSGTDMTLQDASIACTFVTGGPKSNPVVLL